MVQVDPFVVRTTTSDLNGQLPQRRGAGLARPLRPPGHRADGSGGLGHAARGRAGPTHGSGKPFIDVGSGPIPCRPGVRHSAAVTSSRQSQKAA